MPKILIVSIPPLPAPLDQASGSALIPSDQQKYSENPIIPPKLRYLAANSTSRLKRFRFTRRPKPVRGRSGPLEPGNGVGFPGKRTDPGKSEGSLDAVTSPHLCTCLLPQRLNPNPKGLNLCVPLGQPSSFPVPSKGGKNGVDPARFCSTTSSTLKPGNPPQAGSAMTWSLLPEFLLPSIPTELFCRSEP